MFLWSPVELLKLRAQLQTASPGTAGYCNPAALAAQVVRQDGVAGEPGGRGGGGVGWGRRPVGQVLELQEGVEPVL